MDEDLALTELAVVGEVAAGNELERRDSFTPKRPLGRFMELCCQAGPIQLCRCRVCAR